MGAALIALGAGSGGCGSDTKADPPTAAPVQNTPIPPPLTPLALPSVGDPFTYPLVTVRGADSNYSIEVPAEWVRETGPSGAEQFTIKIGPYTGAYLSVTCGEPSSGDPAVEYSSRNLALREVDALSGRGRLGESAGVTDIEVNGRAAAIYTDTRTLGPGAATNGTSVFIATPECAWAIRFVQIASPPDPSSYTQLFGRIVSTFVPGEPG